MPRHRRYGDGIGEGNLYLICEAADTAYRALHAMENRKLTNRWIAGGKKFGGKRVLLKNAFMSLRGGMPTALAPEVASQRHAPRRCNHRDVEANRIGLLPGAAGAGWAKWRLRPEFG